MVSITENNPINRIKLGQAKRYILKDKNGIPQSVVITSAVSPLDLKAVSDVIHNTGIKRLVLSSFTKKRGVSMP